MRATRRTKTQNVEPEAQPELETIDTETESQKDTETEVKNMTETAVRPTRQPIQTGAVEIAPSEDQESTGRATRLDTDPVPVAVRDAVEDTWYDIKVATTDEDGNELDTDTIAKRINGVKALLRRAGQRYEKGIHIDPRNHADKVRFKTGPRREVKKNKEATETEQPVAAVETATDDNVSVVGSYDLDSELATAQHNTGYASDWQ